jgi:predicted MFS family arabinose efflux permease
LLHSKLAALLVAAAVPCLAFAAVAGLRLDARAPSQIARETSPESRRFLLRYVVGVAPWYAFMAGVFPFFNVYLSRVHHASTEAIGGTFAAAQLLQALAVLSMGWWIARLGLVRSVLLSQLLTSLAVLAFLPARSLAAAGVIYTVYVSLMVMPEPALQNLLMDRMAESERAKGAAINEMLALGTNVVVVAGAGWLITRAGYSTLFAVLFGVGLAAMLAFYAALGRPAGKITR